MKCPNCQTLLPDFRRFERRVCQNCGEPVRMSAAPKKQTVVKSFPLTDKQPISNASQSLIGCEWCIIIAAASLIVFVVCALLYSKLDMPTLLPGLIGFLSLMIFAVLAVFFLIITIVEHIRQGVDINVQALILTFFFCFAVSMSFILLSYGIINKIYYEKNKDQFVQIEARISKIVTETDDDGDKDHQVYITYTLKETTYQDVAYPHYSSSMAQGDTVTVTVDTNNPEDLPDDPMVVICISAVALVVFSACLYFLCLRQLLKRKQ